MTDHREDLRNTRERIDELDREIVRLLQERARLALIAARHKKALGRSLLDESREAGVLAEVAASRGPLEGGSLERIYRVIMEETRKTEERGA